MLLMTFVKIVEEFEDADVVSTSLRFVKGIVPKQNKTFAPSVAEFCSECRSQKEFREFTEAPKEAIRLPRRYDLPFEAWKSQDVEENSNRKLISEGISFNVFLKMTQKRQLQPGSRYIARSKLLFGPVSLNAMGGEQ